MNGQTVPTGYASSTDILISFGPEDVARVAVGVAFLLLAFAFRRALPAWARWALLAVGVALIVWGAAL